MEAHVEIGGGQPLHLKGAILVYSATGRAFCSWHEARRTESGAPQLAEGTALTTEFVRQLAGQLMARPGVEILPEKILARSDGTIVWWMPAALRPVFFRTTDEEASGLANHRFPHPAIVWKVQGRALSVRALAENTRPRGSSNLYIAPYFNCDGEDGDVCQGSMRSPDSAGVEAIEQWERAFFQSEFTHQTGARKLTSHPGGFYGLWRSLRGKTRFPTKYLVPANETLAEFARRDSR